MSDGEFSVWVFQEGGWHYPVARFVDAGAAVGLAIEATDKPDAQRIIITDGGDFTVWEWVYNKGIVWQ